MKLSVIIPTFDEERTVAELLTKVLNAKLPDGVTKEIIVVNDGSTDKTVDIVEEFVQEHDVKLFHQTNQGKTAAVLKGIAQSSGDIILIQDADLEYDPNQYSELLKPIVSGKYQVVYGSRFMGKIQNMRKRNRLANFMTNLTLNCIFHTKMTDNNTCFKVFTKKALEGITITSHEFGFDCEVTVKILQKKIAIHEIPIRYVGRSHAEGRKIRFLNSFQSYLQIFRYSFVKQ